jgi:hypothetical protein
MAIRFHNTDIVRAYPDGQVQFDCRGWVSSPTTAKALREATLFMPFHFSVFSRRVMSLNQTVVQRNGKTFRYYDGITFDGEGNIITPLQPFQARRIDKAEAKAFMDSLQTSGFKDMFKVLYATVQPPDHIFFYPRTLSDSLTNPEQAADWPHIIAKYKYAQQWTGFGGGKQWQEVGTAKTCWSRMMAMCKSNMYKNVTTGVVSI